MDNSRKIGNRMPSTGLLPTSQWFVSREENVQNTAEWEHRESMPREPQNLSSRVCHQLTVKQIGFFNFFTSIANWEAENEECE